jgi:PPK2 family polyphosphate:nucleotide phosphotransferase
MSRGSRLVRPFRVDDGRGFRLADIDPGETLGVKKEAARGGLLEKGIERLRALQEKLYAQDRWAILLIFQAMDAAGKDGTIEHVMSGVNPQGCQVYSFKAPSSEELDHDFLWRTARCLPERGRIGIFNRSYYEEVLVVRVHPEILAAQRLPKRCMTRRIWQERYDDINAHERYLARNGTAIRKFFLHVSKEEQRRRFLDRVGEPEKNWKFSMADARERRFWDAYQSAYEEMIRSTSTRHAPWVVVPADHKWFTRVVVAEAIVDALEELDLSLPRLGPARRKDLKAARAALLSENGEA